MSLRVAITARSIFPLHGVGGLERHLYELVCHLARAGVQVHVATRPPTRANPRDVPAFASGRIEWSFVPYRTFPFAGRRGTTVIDRSTAYLVFGLRAGARAAALANAGSVDVVYGHGASVLGYALLKRRGRVSCPLIFNPHGLEEFGGAGQSRAKWLAYAPLRAAVRACARAADRVIATDNVQIPSLCRHLRVPADRVRLVPNAVDLDACNPAGEVTLGSTLRSTLSLPREGVVLVSAGRLEQNKGFHILARSLALLPKNASLPEWRWVLVGDGPFRSRLERTIRELKLSDRVRLPGFVSTEELHGWYRAADLFVHPTLYEGSSIVTLEAMARELPVVATRAGGLPDKVLPGTNGWLVEPGDVDALAGAVSEALRAGPRLAEMGRASRRLVEEQFSWTSAVGALISAIREVENRL
jgi:glycosyltransferase involved in cell wall biosynthesis